MPLDICILHQPATLWRMQAREIRHSAEPTQSLVDGASRGVWSLSNMPPQCTATHCTTCCKNFLATVKVNLDIRQSVHAALTTSVAYLSNLETVDLQGRRKQVKEVQSQQFKTLKAFSIIGQVCQQPKRSYMLRWLP